MADGPGASPDEMAIGEFRRVRASVLATIAAACARAGRAPGSVTLVAVSKTVTVDRLRSAVAAGLDVLGENRVQEAADKVPLVPGARWHLVGPLQSNKARRALELFDVIESVDSAELALRLDRILRELRGMPSDGALPPAERFPVFLQVNIDDDPAKAGLRPGDVAAAARLAAAPGGLEIVGLMTIGRLVASPEDARSTFRSLRLLSEDLRSVAAPIGPGLSMGMSEDYAVAVEEGATHVRVGRAIFGERALGPSAEVR